jgi:hypothetical protein
VDLPLRSAISRRTYDALAIGPDDVRYGPCKIDMMVKQGRNSKARRDQGEFDNFAQQYDCPLILEIRHNGQLYGCFVTPRPVFDMLEGATV